MRASLTNLGGDELCPFCDTYHQDFDECAKCGADLPLGTCFICVTCNGKAEEAQGFYAGAVARERLSSHYRNAGIPFEVANLEVDEKLSKKAGMWASRTDHQWGGLTNAGTVDRRLDSARALKRRIRARRDPAGAGAILTDRFSGMEWSQLDEIFRAAKDFELLTIDIAVPMTQQIDERMQGLLTYRHWSGEKPAATFITSAEAPPKWLAALLNDNKSLPPKKRPTGPEPEGFEKHCFDCGKVVIARFKNSTAWICATCAKR